MGSGRKGRGMLAVERVRFLRLVDLPVIVDVVNRLMHVPAARRAVHEVDQVLEDRRVDAGLFLSH